jgi:outer membrane protein assembly factor BamB
MMKRCLGCLLTLLFLELAGARAAENPFQPQPFDWPQWRGSKRDSVCTETGLLQQWPEEGPKLLWKARNLGGGYSTPSVAAGRIFGMSFRGKDEGVWALDANTGKELWWTRIADRGRIGYGEGSRCTPTVDGASLYALGVSGDLACLEVATGKICWQKSLTRDFGGRMMSGWGYSESPLVDGDVLVCTPGGKNATLVALDKHTGDVSWKAQVPEGDGAAYSSIVVAEVGSRRLYVQLLGRGIVGVSAKDGRFLWRYNRIANGTANIPTPIVKDNYVFCSTGYNSGSALLKLVADGVSVRAEEVYYLPGRVLQNHHGGMVLVGDYLYGGHGHKNGFPVCIKLKTGEVVWRKDRGPGTGSAAVLYADGNLYFRYENGLMALIAATPEGYKEKSTFRLPETSGRPSWPHPVIANGHLLIRDQDVLLCYDVKQH